MDKQLAVLLTLLESGVRSPVVDEQVQRWISQFSAAGAKPNLAPQFHISTHRIIFALKHDAIQERNKESLVALLAAILQRYPLHAQDAAKVRIA